MKENVNAITGNEMKHYKACLEPKSQTNLQRKNHDQNEIQRFIFHSSDALSHSAHPFSEREKHDVIRNITFLLGQTFSSQFVFPVLGHEDSLSFHHLGELWRQWLPTEAVQTFEKGEYNTLHLQLLL